MLTATIEQFNTFSFGLKPAISNRTVILFITVDSYKFCYLYALELRSIRLNSFLEPHQKWEKKIMSPPPIIISKYNRES